MSAPGDDLVPDTVQEFLDVIVILEWFRDHLFAEGGVPWPALADRRPGPVLHARAVARNWQGHPELLRVALRPGCPSGEFLRLRDLVDRARRARRPEDAR